MTAKEWDDRQPPLICPSRRRRCQYHHVINQRFKPCFHGRRKSFFSPRYRARSCHRRGAGANPRREDNPQPIVTVAAEGEF